MTINMLCATKIRNILPNIAIKGSVFSILLVIIIFTEANPVYKANGLKQLKYILFDDVRSWIRLDVHIGLAALQMQSV